MTDSPAEQPERTRFVDPPRPQAPPAASPLEDRPDAGPVRPVSTQAVEQPAPAAVPTAASAQEDTGYAAPVRAPGVPRVLVALVVLLVALTAALTVWVTRPVKTGFESQGAPALVAAKAAAKLVLAYDYRTLEKGFQAALAVTTDADGKDCPHQVDPADKAYDAKASCFRSEYSRTHELVVVDLATRYKTIVIADVGAGGVERVEGNRVTVLLYVNQQSTSTQSANPKITQSRVEMVMQKVGSRWLVADIKAL